MSAEPPSDPPAVVLRPARTADVRDIRRIAAPYVAQRRLVAKAAVAYFESLQEFRVAEVAGRVAAFGALHVMWEDLAEVRTLAVDPKARGLGLGSRLLDTLLAEARDLGTRRVFCLTFETGFFARHGFVPIEGETVTAQVYAELLRSYDEGVAEFLDLERVKPNTLGNTRMLRTL